jgi:hypothetical protein
LSPEQKLSSVVKLMSSGHSYKGNPRWLFYAYDRIRKRVLAHVFGPRNAVTLQRLLALLSKFNIAFYDRCVAGIPDVAGLSQPCSQQEIYPANRAS